MLDNETRRRIDSARDILVGKVPDPKSQVEQITIALIYKFMDDMDKEAIEFGGKSTFFTGEYEKYGWSKIFDPRLGGYEMLSLYGEAIEKLDQNPNIPQLFRDIFKNAYLPYRDPETLKLFLKTINEFHYDHSEKLGEKWELEIQSEYKTGTNNSQFDTSCIVGKKMSNYQLEGFYVLPNLKYSINSQQIKSLEFSCRYESLNCDMKRNGNTKQTWMPVFSLQLADEYFLKFETGLIIDKYSVTTSKEHSGTRFVCQMQARF